MNSGCKFFHSMILETVLILGFAVAAFADIITIGTLPTGNERVTVFLDGEWDCTVTDFSQTSVPTVYDNTIPVPGFWDMATRNLGTVRETSALWYHKTVHLQEIPGSVILRINKAHYGRKVYINGQLVLDYPYNFTASETNIREFLVEGDNEIIIRLGNYLQQRDDPACPAHTGSDYEKNSYLPGIPDSISLLLCSNPVVESVRSVSLIDTNGDMTGELKVNAMIRNDLANSISNTAITFTVHFASVDSIINIV